MRVFFDTNVLVAAFAARGLCAELFEIVIFDHELVVGSRTMTELRRALGNKVKLSSGQVADIARFVMDQASPLVPATGPADVPVDPDDAWILAEAIAGRADVFVTGDAGILAVGSIGAMPICSPRQFWQLLRAAG